MMSHDTGRAVSALRNFARRPEPESRCDLCNAPVAESHAHLYEPEPRRIACACIACSFLFPEGTAGRYRSLHSRATRAAGVELVEDDFRALEIPVRLAFLAPSDVHARVFATYPTSHGATESVVPRAAWDALAERTALSVAPDAEGLLIDYLGGRTRCFVASLDVCYRFVGLLRAGGAARGTAFASAMRFLDGLGGLDGGGHG
ncbi:MAG TPA: DUF5947 family protein [Polyangiaceae bacterium]|jgi:hypothetical protein|nr:DUF5947 family protein [Polyangiaceae bacterium]